MGGVSGRSSLLCGLLVSSTLGTGGVSTTDRLRLPTKLDPGMDPNSKRSLSPPVHYATSSVRGGQAWLSSLTHVRLLSDALMHGYRLPGRGFVLVGCWQVVVPHCGCVMGCWLEVQILCYVTHTRGHVDAARSTPTSKGEWLLWCRCAW